MLTYIDSIAANIGVMSVSMVGEIFFTQTVFGVIGVMLAVIGSGFAKTKAVLANIVTISVKLVRCSL